MFVHICYNMTLINKVSLYVSQVTDFIFFLGKASLTAGMVVAAYNIFTRPVRLLDNSGQDVTLIYPWLSIAIVGFITYVVTSIFFSVYAMAVDTLFLCFCKYLYIPHTM